MGEKIFPVISTGGVETENPIWLAPLAGVTTRAFRDFHRRMGAGLTHTEMISATGLLYKNKKTFKMIGDSSEPEPTVVQLFGPSAPEIVRAAEAALRIKRFDAIEINMACPMPKVTKKCGGASLLSNPDEAAMMVAGLKPLGPPVWVKLRKTLEGSRHIGTINFCKKMRDAGADLLIIHGRTPAQRYEGESDKEAVISAAREFPGLVAATGDFFTPGDAEFYLNGGCVAVLAARGVIKDALLIPRTLHALGRAVDGKLIDPSVPDRADMLLAAGMDAKSRDGERHAIVMIKRLMAGMFKGSRGVSELKRTVASSGDWPSLEDALLRFAENRR